MDDDTVLYVLVFLFGCAVGIMLIAIIFEFNKSIIHEDVLDEVCQHLSENENAVFVEGPTNMFHSKFICEIPSFDETTKIIIREAGQE